MFAAIQSATLLGVEGRAVVVEVHAGAGLPGFQMVGLPDESCREARDRVRAALASAGVPWPNKRLTVNLSPPRHRKTGSGLDLAIAIGVLVADEKLPAESVHGTAFVGELGLDGSVRPVPGVAPMVGVSAVGRVVVPADNVAEARVAASGHVRAARHLAEVVAALAGVEPWPEVDEPSVGPQPSTEPDLADVAGQRTARLALELAAAGGHHLLLVGPPGSGKTMLARRLAGLLPPLEREVALEATMVHSAAGVGVPASGLVRRAPFRAPHHTSSTVALVGGGSHSLRPGEVSLAHGGVLFLDELGEFPRSVLDSLRQPLEDGTISVARAHLRATMPARFVLVAATNPCPCGGGPPGQCECDEGRRQRYLHRLSGPLLDRFDLRVAVQRPAAAELIDGGAGESSAVVAARVARARDVARSRHGCLNGELRGAALDEVAPLTGAARALLRDELERGRLTGRGLHRVRRVARTIADLAAADSGVGAVSHVDVDHVQLALSLRARLDRSDPAGRVA